MNGKLVKLIGIILVISKGIPYTVNISHIKSLTSSGNRCILRQYYNPHTIVTDESCEEIQEKIQYEGFNHGE